MGTGLPGAHAMPKPPCARAALLAAFLGLNASASLIGGEWLQLNFTDGYNPAAKLMEALETAGIVSPAELGGSRRILANKDNV